MKTLLTALLLTSAAANAYVIKGTMVAWGTSKTTTYKNGAEIRCSIKVDKRLFGKDDISNLREEDQFGNPAYKVNAQIELNSRDRKIVDLKFKEKITFTNLHPQGVSDSLYATLTPRAPAPTATRPNPVAPAKGTEARFTIDDSGAIKSLQVQTTIGPVNCTF